MSPPGFSTIPHQRQETVAQRYGSAQEPQLPPPPKPSDRAADKTLAEAIETEVKAPAKVPEKSSDISPQTKEESTDAAQAKSSTKSAISTPKDGDVAAKDLSSEQLDTNPAAQTAEQLSNSPLVKRAVQVNEKASPPRPLETMFEIPTPTADKPEEYKAPHMQAPPYVHHFDTYTLVKDLGTGGFTEEQSVTLMKAVRGLLAVNLDVAKEGLVGKSDVENVYILYSLPCPS